MPRSPLRFATAGCLLAFVAAVIVAELALQVGARLAPAIDRVTSDAGDATGASRRELPDPRLGTRGNPRFPGHDARGFRNARALDSAVVVALGDSHTYGTSVRREEAWPSRLSALLRRPVYNMGIGGWGPGQALASTPAALALHPSVLVFGLYFGNDFYDALAFAASHGLAALISPDTLAIIDSLQRVRPIGAEILFLFAQTSAPRDSAAPAPRRQAFSFRRFVAEHSRLYGLARSVRRRLSPQPENPLLLPTFDEARRALTPAQLPYVSPFEGGGWKTIFTAPYRLTAENDGDARIRAGIEITKHDLAAMRDSAAHRSARFVVLLLPTKEYVFWPRVERPSHHPGLERLVATEGRLHEELESFMRGAEIEYVDPVAGLRAADRQPYHENGDGHPNAVGQDIIARALGRYLAPPGTVR